MERSKVLVAAYWLMMQLPALGTEGTISVKEREALAAHLRASSSALRAEIENLSGAQWHWRPGEGRWPVAECAEHPILAESFLFDSMESTLKRTASGGSDPSMDAQILSSTADRTRKPDAPEPATRRGAYFERAVALAEVARRRERTRAFVLSTEAPLRAHVMKSPGGSMDAYQILLMLSAHTERHTEQIREVKKTSGFPER